MFHFVPFLSGIWYTIFSMHFPSLDRDRFLFCSRIQINTATAVLRQSNRNSLKNGFSILCYSIPSQLFENLFLYYSVIQILEFHGEFFSSVKCKTVVSFHHFNNYNVVTIFKVGIRISLMVSVVKNFKSKRNNKTENDGSRKMVGFWSFSTFT